MRWFPHTTMGMGSLFIHWYSVVLQSVPLELSGRYCNQILGLDSGSGWEVLTDHFCLQGALDLPPAVLQDAGWQRRAGCGKLCKAGLRALRTAATTQASSFWFSLAAASWFRFAAATAAFAVLLVQELQKRESKGTMTVCMYYDMWGRRGRRRGKHPCAMLISFALYIWEVMLLCIRQEGWSGLEIDQWGI